MSEQTIINIINKTPDKPACYILRGTNGDLLIDTGHFMCKGAVEKFFLEHDVKWIFLTHGHFDHVWNAPRLKEKYGCKVILHEKDRELYEEKKYIKLYPTRKKYMINTIAANRLLKKFKPPICEIDYFLTDKDTDFLRKLGFDADIIMLPGHTAGCMGIKAGDAFYVGDACSSVKAHYKTVYLGEDIDALRESDKKIRHSGAAYVCPGHGSVIDMRKEF